MPAPTVASPNVGNYQVGKGVVSFKKEGDSVYRDLGNVSELTLSPDLTTLEHFSSRGGTKTKDLVIVLEKKSTLKIVMDEITADNLALMLLGDVDTSAVGGPEIDIYASTAISGALKFVGANEIGAQVTMDLYNVTFTPSGDVGFISDEFNNLEATADVLVKTGIAPVYAEGVYTLSGSLRTRWPTLRRLSTSMALPAPITPRQRPRAPRLKPSRMQRTFTSPRCQRLRQPATPSPPPIPQRARHGEAQRLPGALTVTFRPASSA
jgi:hypothetical protein